MLSKGQISFYTRFHHPSIDSFWDSYKDDLKCVLKITFTLHPLILNESLSCGHLCFYTTFHQCSFNGFWAVRSTHPPYVALVSVSGVFSKFLVQDSSARGWTFLEPMNMCTVLYNTSVQPIGMVLNMAQYKLYTI